MGGKGWTVLAAVAVHAAACTAASPAHAPLGNREFWDLTAAVSEPDGSFVHSDNLVSNETQFAEFAAALDPRGGVYIGVGPEQNFTYISRLRPALAFIVDIRRDNRNLHLMYKALFELAANRADFVGRLFSRQTPPGIDQTTPVDDIFAALDEMPPSGARLAETTALLRRHLRVTREFEISEADLGAIESALHAFYTDGPEIRYGRALPAGETRPPYRRLMTGKDHRGIRRSYLATESAFQFVKQLQAGNRVVPVIGDFAGPHALRRIGEYARGHSLAVTTFYASNVEVYLSRDQRRTFCGNLTTLPYDAETVFLGNRRLMPLSDKLVACTAIPPSLRWP
jgi:hypothetical protein